MVQQTTKMYNLHVAALKNTLEQQKITIYSHATFVCLNLTGMTKRNVLNDNIPN